MKDTKFRLGKLKKILLVLCLIFVVVTVIYGIESAIIYNRQPSTKYVQSTRPTLFFHGFGSGSLAERHMARAAVKSGVTNTVIEVNVDKSGNVTLDGKIEKGAINPIVLVNYEDNKNPNYRQHICLVLGINISDSGKFLVCFCHYTRFPIFFIKRSILIKIIS